MAEVAHLDARRLFEERCFLQVVRVEDEGEVAADCGGLEQLKAVVVDVLDLVEGLPRLEARGLVLALEDVDIDELVWNLEPFEYAMVKKRVGQNGILLCTAN